MYLEELDKNIVINLPPQKIDKQEMLDFSKKYDNIPLHTDEQYAKTTRFGKLIAPGYLSLLAVWSKFIEQDFFGEELIAGKSSKIEWFKPVFEGDELSGEITITNIAERNAYNGIVETTLKVFNQNEEMVLTNITECVVKRKI